MGRENNNQETDAPASEWSDLLAVALRSICLTRDYVGEDSLPAIDGWEWYEAGKAISNAIPNNEWAGEFRKRVNIYKSRDVREAFKIGDYVFGLGDNLGCYQVFEGNYCNYQPFSYLNDYDPNNYRLATADEIESAQRYDS